MLKTKSPAKKRSKAKGKKRPAKRTRKAAATFTWAAPGRVFEKKARANDVWRELQRIKAREGRLTPQLVVDNARENKVLSSLFEWNLRKAASRHWLETARRIMRSIEVIRVTPKGVEQRTVFVSVRQPEKNGGPAYYTVEEVAGNPKLVILFWRDALASLEGWIGRFSDLRERLPDVVGSVEAATKGLAREIRRKSR